MVNLIDYQSFITNQMQIPASALPLGSPVILMSLAIAEDVVNTELMRIPNIGVNLGYTGPTIYELAVYNLAADNLINFAQDQAGQTYFSDLRSAWKINSFVPGVIQSSGDETSLESLLAPEFMKNLTLSDLQNLKTPYGRQYLALAQKYGSLWGMS